MVSYVFLRFTFDFYVVPKVAKVSFIRSINISLNIEIFVDLFDELLYQKVTRLLNEQIMIVFTTQVVKYDQIYPKGFKRVRPGSPRTIPDLEKDPNWGI